MSSLGAAFVGEQSPILQCQVSVSASIFKLRSIISSAISEDLFTIKCTFSKAKCKVSKHVDTLLMKDFKPGGTKMSGCAEMLVISELSVTVANKPAGKVNVFQI